ncbi:MAG: dihydrodipicolinate synthase family protein, partial [Chloroflexota bacterium]
PAMTSVAGHVEAAAGAVTTDRGRWREILTDVAVVTVTPFSGPQLGSVDHDGLARNIRRLVGAGIRLLVAGGNTGEFAALAPSEVVDVVRTHVRVARGRARVLAGIGYRLEEAAELGRRAMDAGAEGLLVHQPIHPYASERGLIRYYELLGDALPGVPLTLYVRGSQLSAEGAREVSRIDSVVGVKVGVADVERFERLVDAAPELAWVCGVAETWAVPFHERGAVGFTSGVANVLPERSLAVFDALRAGDVARASALVDELRPIEDLRAAHDGANNVAAIKAAMDRVGLVGGDLRPPLSSLDADDATRLAEVLRAMEVLG